MFAFRTPPPLSRAIHGIIRSRAIGLALLEARSVACALRMLYADKRALETNLQVHAYLPQRHGAQSTKRDLSPGAAGEFAQDSREGAPILHTELHCHWNSSSPSLRLCIQWNNPGAHYARNEDGWFRISHGLFFYAWTWS